MNKKKKIIFLLIFQLSCVDIGESYNWKDENLTAGFNRNFGSIGYDYGWAVDDSPYDNGIVIVGSKESSINGEKNMWAVKTDERGFADFDKSFGGINNEDSCNYSSKKYIYTTGIKGSITNRINANDYLPTKKSEEVQ